jgi:hypothetical protein
MMLCFSAKNSSSVSRMARLLAWFGIEAMTRRDLLSEEAFDLRLEFRSPPQRRRSPSRRSRLAISLFLVLLYRWFPSVLKAIMIIRPETLVR